MSATILNNISAQKEKVRSITEKLFESSAETVAMIPKANDVTNVGRYGYRFPLHTVPASQWAKVGMDGGVLPMGTASRHRHLMAAFFWSANAIRITQEQIDLSESSEVSAVNLMSEVMGDSAEAALAMMNIAFFGDGTGILTAGASSEGDDDMTFATASDTLQTRLLREGMAVNAWTSNGVTKRASADTGLPLYILSIDKATHNVVLSQVVTALAADDVLTFSNIDTYGPAALVSYQSGWPTAPGSQTGGGIGGDSYIHGLKYVNDATASRYYLGIQKSALPRLKPAFIAAGGAALDFTFGAQIRGRLQRDWDGDDVEGMLGIWPEEQRAHLFSIGMNIVSKQIVGESFGRMFDMYPSNAKYADEFRFCDFRNRVSKRQSADRIDFIRLADWGRVVASDMQAYKSPSGQDWFPVYNADGQQTTTWQRWDYIGMDFLCHNPGKGGYITGLAVPAQL